MRSSDRLIGEAVASLTARLTEWGVDDPAAKAHDYVTAMLRNGWRPIARAVEPPAAGVRCDPETRALYVQRAREALRSPEGE